MPGKDHRARENRGRAEEEAAIDVLAEDDPGDAHGRQAFEIEQQRARRSRRSGETEHQEERTQDATERHDGDEPRPIRAPQRRLRRLGAERRPRHQDKRQSATRAEVEESGENLRVDRRQQQLGERRGGAEQDRRRQGKRHAGPEMRVRMDAFRHAPTFSRSAGLVSRASSLTFWRRTACQAADHFGRPDWPTPRNHLRVAAARQPRRRGFTMKGTASTTKTTAPAPRPAHSPACRVMGLAPARPNCRDREQQDGFDG